MRPEQTQPAAQFIAFEGIDGSGKTTQARLLCQKLTQHGVRATFTQEPTDGPAGRVIRQIMRGEYPTDERVIAPLYVADRTDHLLHPETGILRQLAAGITVVTDRYYLSSCAYQSFGIPMERVLELNADCIALARPAVTLFLDLSPEAAMARIAAGRAIRELFETQERLTAVRQRYFDAFARLRDVENVVVLDAAQEETSLAEEIWTRLRPRFPQAE